MKTNGFGWTLAILISGALLLGLVSWRLLFFSSMPRALPDVYLELPPGEAPALAPDRSLLAYVSRHGDDWLLHLRELEGGGVTRLQGTEGSRSPFFSADGRSLGFVSSGVMKELALGEKKVEPRDIAFVGEIRGASFGSDGAVVFGSAEGVRVVSSSGGSPETLARLEDEGDGARFGFPQSVPGGGWVVFDVRRGEKRQIEAVHRGDGDRHEVLENAFLPRYAATGHLLFLRGSAIWAVRFDPVTARPLGEPVKLVSDVEGGENGWYDLSPRGTFAFRRPETGRADHRAAFGVVSNWLVELERLLPAD